MDSVSATTTLDARDDESVSDQWSETRLPFGDKMKYGFSGLAGQGMMIITGMFLPIFYSDTIGVPLGLVAIAIAIATAFDAITDPALGWISDRTQTRWGRRIPWLAVGLPGVAIAFWLLFSPPETLTTTGAAIWFAAVYLVFVLFQTVFSIPYYALGYELSLDYNDRTSLFAVSSYFGVIGMVLASWLPELLEIQFGMTPRAAYNALGIIYAVLMVVTSLFLLQLRERPEFITLGENPFVPGVRKAMRNGPFVIVLITYILVLVSFLVPMVLIFYHTRYVLQVENAEFWVAVYAGILTGTGLFTIPVWAMISKRIGKLPALIIAQCIGAGANFALFWAGAGDVWYVLGIMIVLGFLGGVDFLILAMEADIADYDELLTGKRREGQLSALFGIVPKLVAIPGAAIPLSVLAAAGFVPNQVQTPEVISNIKWMYILMPVAFYIINIFIFLRYPISKKVHNAIGKAIEAHVRGESALDPVTGKMLLPPGTDIDEADDWQLDNFSPGELRRMTQHGPGILIRDVILSILVSLAIFVAGMFLTVRTILGMDINEDPGTWCVVWITTASAGLTALVFHILRFKPARQMVRHPINQDVVLKKIEAVSKLKRF